MDDTLRPQSVRLSLQELAAIGPYAAAAAWPAGFTIYQRGAAADGLFVVTRGCIVLRSRIKAGRGFVPSVTTPGEVFGAEGMAKHARYVTDARADEAAETLHLSGARFRAFVREQPQHALTLVSQVMSQHVALLEKLRELATLSVEERMVSTLLTLTRHRGFCEPDGRITLDSARYRLLCELVGATRESVSLVLGRLVNDGLAERQGSTFVVASAPALTQRLDQARASELNLIPVASEEYPVQRVVS